MTTTADQLKSERQARHRRGHASERLAAVSLMLKGYRILARRYKATTGEIDLIACRGRDLVFVEVKQRASHLACEAAISTTQRQRLRRAANTWLARNPRFHRHAMHFDAIFVTPYRWPRHVPDGA